MTDFRNRDNLDRLGPVRKTCFRRKSVLNQVLTSLTTCTYDSILTRMEAMTPQKGQIMIWSRSQLPDKMVHPPPADLTTQEEKEVFLLQFKTFTKTLSLSSSSSKSNCLCKLMNPLRKIKSTIIRVQWAREATFIATCKALETATRNFKIKSSHNDLSRNLELLIRNLRLSKGKHHSKQFTRYVLAQMRQKLPHVKNLIVPQSSSRSCHKNSSFEQLRS